MKTLTQPLLYALAIAAITISRAPGATAVSATLPLVAATPTANTFATTVEVLGQQDTQTILYSGVIRPVMGIDFTNPSAPVVQTLDFAGLDADIAHTNATFTVPLGTAVFTNISGRVKTPAANSPAPVTGGTTFNSADHNLIAWHGTIDVTPIIGSPTQIDLFTSQFTGSLTGVNNSTINVTLASLVAGVATYDVDVNAKLDDMLITTGKPDIDNLIHITIDGNVVAHGQFTQTVAVPEPAALGLASLAIIGLTRIVLVTNSRRHFTRMMDSVSSRILVKAF